MLKKIAFILGNCIAFVGTLLSYYLRLNTEISLKYETEIGECISTISGIDLCSQLDTYQNLTYFFGISFAIIFGFTIIKIIRWKPYQIQSFTKTL